MITTQDNMRPVVFLLVCAVALFLLLTDFSQNGITFNSLRLSYSLRSPLLPGSEESWYGSRDLPLQERRKSVQEKWNLELLISNNVSNSDPRLIRLVQELLDPPAQKGQLLNSRPIVSTPQSDTALRFFNTKEPKFYVECGALDGERASNTLYLEKQGWQGLLIEANPQLYSQILGKNRHAWSINACLSNKNYTQTLRFSPVGGHGHIIRRDLVDSLDRQYQSVVVPCFTMETILLALNITRVDFFSLDVEGVELEVLKTIPFHKLDIKSIVVEYLHVEGGVAALKEFLTSVGYQFIKKLDKEVPADALYVHDLFFLKT